MNKILIILLSSAIIVLAVTYGTDLVTNGSFENFSGTPDDGQHDTFTGWTDAGKLDGDSADAVTDKVKSGTYAIELATGGSNTTWHLTSVNISVVVNTQYNVSFWSTGENNSSRYGQLRIRDITQSTYIISAINTNYTLSWVEIDCTFTIPVGCENIQVWIYPVYYANNTMWLDSLILREIIPDPEEEIQKRGFNIFNTINKFNR